MSDTWKITGEITYPKGENPLDNRFYGYRSTDFDLPDGRKARYHGVLVPTCGHIVAVETDLTTYLVRQNRPNARAMHSSTIPKTLELPGGFMNPNASWFDAINDELAEEVGKRAEKVFPLGKLYPSPGMSNEIDTIYLGMDLQDVPAPSVVEATEQGMGIVSGRFGKMYDQMLTGRQPVAAQTLAAMAMAAAHL